MISGMGSTSRGADIARRCLLIALAFSFLLPLRSDESAADPPKVCLTRLMAGPEHPILCPGHLLFEARARFTPKALPAREGGPVAVHFEAKVKEKNGHPPALREVNLEMDENVTVDATGFPVCRNGSIVRSGVMRAQRLCGEAIVGVGQVQIEIDDPGELRTVSSPLAIFNGGTRDGRTRLLFQLEPVAPLRVPLVAIARSRPTGSGRFGTELNVAFPPIAEGNGSVLAFGFDLRRALGGGEVGIVRARCRDGHLAFRASGTFVDGSRLGGAGVRFCAVSGPAES